MTNIKTSCDIDIYNDNNMKPINFDQEGKLVLALIMEYNSLYPYKLTPTKYKWVLEPDLYMEEVNEVGGLYDECIKIDEKLFYKVLKNLHYRLVAIEIMCIEENFCGSSVCFFIKRLKGEFKRPTGHTYNSLRKIFLNYSPENWKWRIL